MHGLPCAPGRGGGRDSGSLHLSQWFKPEAPGSRQAFSSRSSGQLPPRGCQGRLYGHLSFSPSSKSVQERLGSGSPGGPGESAQQGVREARGAVGRAPAPPEALMQAGLEHNRISAESAARDWGGARRGGRCGRHGLGASPWGPASTAARGPLLTPTARRPRVSGGCHALDGGSCPSGPVCRACPWGPSQSCPQSWVDDHDDAVHTCCAQGMCQPLGVTGPLSSQFRDGETAAPPRKCLPRLAHDPAVVGPQPAHDPAVVGPGRSGTGGLTLEHTLSATGLSHLPSYSPWAVATWWVSPLGLAADSGI